MPKQQQQVDIGPAEDGQLSHREHSFCYDMSCPCHEDKELVAEMGKLVNDGLASTDDADRLYRGRNV